MGDFFRMTSERSVYCGDTALDLAVSLNQIDIVNLLMGYPRKGEFYGKWRASIRLKDHQHLNTVFHLCALRGLVEMWYNLVEHLEETIATEEMGMSKDRMEVQLAAVKWVKSQVNLYGLTALQVAAFKNNSEMVICILKQTRLKLWKWGDEAYYAYVLNELDDHYKSPED